MIHQLSEHAYCTYFFSLSLIIKRLHIFKEKGVFIGDAFRYSQFPPLPTYHNSLFYYKIDTDR